MLADDVAENNSRSAVSTELSALPRRLGGIDAARAVAAIAVLINHLVLAVTVRSPSWLSSAPRDLADSVARWMVALGGWGVGVFFVLSGLCIHLPMARRLALDPSADLALGPYYRRRFTRIYPPHLVALVGSAAVALALPPPYLGTTFLTSPTWGLFAAHLAMVHSLIPGAIFSISSVLWTIALETHFYLLYPLLLAARRRYRIEVICAALFLVSIALRLLAKGITSPDVSLVVEQSFLRRYWEWTLGCVIAERLVARPRVDWAPRSLVAALLGASYVFGVLVLSLPLGGAVQTIVWPILFAVCIELAARQRNSAGSGVSRAARSIEWIGHTSYSLYLTHPIALAAVIYVARSRGASPAVETLTGLIGAVVLWVAFFYGVERPFLSRASAHRDISRP